jgi:FkbM family methyltransferase
MFNFSGVDSRGAVGRVLRWPLRLLPGNLRMPIWQGRLRGKKWIVGSSDHGCWLGSYEFEKQRVIAGLVRPGAVFLDVGAHVGFYTLLASVLTGDGGRVFAFEPLPRNLEDLRRHLDMNGVRNVTVFRAAVSDHPGEALFHEGPSSSSGRLDENGAFVVDLVSLDDLLLRGAIPLPDFVKIDVEGAKWSVLEGARRLLTLGRPTIFLATHGSGVRARCLDLLQSLGYGCRPLTGTPGGGPCDEVVASKAEANRGPDQPSP